MIGQAISLGGRRYNIVVLAAGLGTRMGEASDYIPKALSSMGESRAIDLIITHYSLIAHKFIIAVSHHADLLINYIRGQYPAPYNIEFSQEAVAELIGSARTASLAMDHVDSRYPTIICFCDLIVPDANFIEPDTILLAAGETTGRVGTFRHSVKKEDVNNISRFIKNNPASSIDALALDKQYGVLGTFAFDNTVYLKKVVYENYNKSIDLTDDIVERYAKTYPMKGNVCGKVYEFGNENDLKAVRELWEKKT